MRAPLIFGLLATLGRWNAVAVAPPGEQKPLGGGEAASDNPFNPEFDQFVADLLERWHVPGVAIAVVDGEETYTKVQSCPRGLGLALRSCSETGARADPPSIYLNESRTMLSSVLACTRVKFLVCKSHSSSLSLL